MSNFEFDPKKSQFNKIKHGIDFYEAQEIWQDFDLVEIQTKYKDELRFLVIGKIVNKHWSAVITYRNNKVRIISARRARKSEVQLYES